MHVTYTILVCRILKNAYLDKEIVLIKKIREKNTHFIVTDHKTQSLLFEFNSTRYKIVSDKNIKKNTGVIVYYDYNKSHIFVRIEGKMYKIILHKLLKSKKGLTKY